MIKVNSIFFKKIWGGSKLKDLGFEISSNKIGEAWIISGYKENSSLLDNGETLQSFYLKNKELFNNYPSKEFPLLVKILDANDDLSIQVHPNDKMARKLENYPFGKTECWYILDAKKNSKLIIDVSTKNRNESKKLINNGKWDSFLLKHIVKKGDVFEINAGTVHAIGSGILLYELQQSSNITYRLYDYDRLDDNGNKRELHIEKSLEVIDYNKKIFFKKRVLQKSIKKSKIYSLVKNKLFNLEEWNVVDELNISLNKNKKNFLLITSIEGKSIINGKNLNPYESCILTSDELKDIKIKGTAKLLVGNPN